MRNPIIKRIAELLAQGKSIERVEPDPMTGPLGKIVVFHFADQLREEMPLRCNEREFDGWWRGAIDAFGFVESMLGRKD